MLLEGHNIVEGSENCLEPQALEAFGLFGGAKLDDDIVIGPFVVLDEMGKGGAADITCQISHTLNI